MSNTSLKNEGLTGPAEPMWDSLSSVWTKPTTYLTTYLGFITTYLEYYNFNSEYLTIIKINLYKARKCRYIIQTHNILLYLIVNNIFWCVYL